MLPESRLSNYWRSLVSYIQTNYTLTAMYFNGENENNIIGIAEWVEFSWNSQVPKYFARHADNVNAGNIVDASIGALIKVKPTSVVGRIVHIRDVVVDLLRRPLIEVLDWVGTKQVIGSLQGEGLIDDTNLGLRDDLNRWSLSFRFRYQEKFERVRP